MEALQSLFEAPPPDASELPLGQQLRDLYGGALALRPDCVYSNFVSSLDGVVAMKGASSGPAISGRSAARRSSVVSARGCSSCSTSCSEPRALVRTGTISSAKVPFCWAATAR